MQAGRGWPGCRGGPLSGVATGAAIPMNSATPSAPAIQTLPAGSMASEVSRDTPLLAYPAAGDIASPVCLPCGQFSGRAPQRILNEGFLELATNTLPLPSTAIPHGPSKPAPVKLRLSRASGRNMVTLRPPWFATHALPAASIAISSGLSSPLTINGEPGAGLPSGAIFATRSLPLPVTHTFPGPSMATPNGSRMSISNVTARDTSPRGNLVMLAPPPLAIQILPQASERMPCGLLRRLSRYPPGGDNSLPVASKTATLLL